MKVDRKYLQPMIVLGFAWLVIDLFFFRGAVNGYAIVPHLDAFSHFFFGLFLGAIGLYFRQSYKRILIITLIVSLLWEYIEKLGDLLFDQPEYLLDYFLFDGVHDILAHFIAVTLIYIILPKMYMKKR